MDRDNNQVTDSDFYDDYIPIGNPTIWNLITILLGQMLVQK